MNAFLFSVLSAQVLGIVVWGMLRAERINYFSTLFAISFGGFALPQLCGLLGMADNLPPNSVTKTLVMSNLCFLSAIAGFHLRVRPLRVFQWTYTPNALLFICLLLTLIGGGFYFIITRLPNESINMGQWTGIVTAYNFFATALPYALVVALFLVLKKPTPAALALGAVSALLILDRAIMGGRRSQAAVLLLTVLLAMWLFKSQTIPRLAFLAVAIAGFFLVYSIGDYRSTVAGQGREGFNSILLGSGLGGLRKVADIAFMDNVQKITREGGSEYIAAVHGIADAEAKRAFDFGLSHWNGFVHHNIPAQFFGQGFKESLKLNLRHAGPTSSGYEKEGSTSEPGIVDAFRSFWYFGCLKFFLIGLLMRLVLTSALAGNINFAFLYIILLPHSLVVVSHPIDFLIQSIIHSTLFLGASVLLVRVLMPSAIVPRPSLPGDSQRSPGALRTLTTRSVLMRLYPRASWSGRTACGLTRPRFFDYYRPRNRFPGRAVSTQGPIRPAQLPLVIAGGLLASCLASSLRGQDVTFSVNDRGLEHISYAGFAFAANDGHDILRSVTARTDSSTSQAGTTVLSRTLDADRRGTVITYPWGSLHLRYTATTNRLYVSATVSNSSLRAVSDVALDVVHIRTPSPPPQYDGSIPLLKTVSDAPVIYLSYSNGALAAANEDPTQPLTVGFPVALDRPTNTLFQFMVNAGIDTRYNPVYYGLAPPIPPGGAMTYRLSLRFGGPGSTAVNLGGDIYSNYASIYPFRLRWPDRRPIGMDGLSVSTASSATNPRGWFGEPNADYISSSGRDRFRRDLLARADQEIGVLKYLHAQGVIIWDIEGSNLSISYVGDPRQLSLLAPEMDAAADDFLTKYREAGLRVGLTIRPQLFDAGTNLPSAGTNGQVFVNVSAPLQHQVFVFTNGAWLQTNGIVQQEVADYGSVIQAKIAYARRRWGATIFYLDSYRAVPPYFCYALTNIYRLNPDVLLLPERRSTGYFSVTAPFLTPQYDGYVTPEYAKLVYPSAFSVIRVFSPYDDYTQLVTSARLGNAFLLNSWYSNAMTARVRQAYVEGALSPPSGLRILSGVN